MGCLVAVIDCYLDQRNPNKCIITQDFKLFQIETTVDNNNVQQSQKYVLDPINGTRVLIYCHGSLFCQLLNTDPKLLKQFKEDSSVVEA